MPRLPLLSGQEVVRALERLGFQQMRQKGSHVVLRRHAAVCVVPLHKQVKTGTLVGVLRQAQVDHDEFVGAAKQ